MILLPVCLLFLPCLCFSAFFRAKRQVEDDAPNSDLQCHTVLVGTPPSFFFFTTSCDPAVEMIRNSKDFVIKEVLISASLRTIAN